MFRWLSETFQRAAACEGDPAATPPKERLMRHPPHLTRGRALVAAVTLAVATTAGAVASLTTATPSRAATCNGYVGLTFDDGPNPSNTNALLNALRTAGVRATLFNIGQNAQANPSLVQAEKSAGMWIGNHSWTHPHLTTLSQSQITSELTQTQQVLQQQTGTAPRLFRPPFGETNATLKSVEAQLGLTEIIWDIDSQDWNNASTAAIVQAAGRLTAGQVILMHDFPPNTIQAIPQIVSGLTGRGLCAGMISPTTGRAVAPDGGMTPPPTTQPPPTTTPPPPPNGASCRVTDAVDAWNNGLTSNLTITNTGTATINGWRLVFTLPGGQAITSGWNATYSPTSGQVTATNVSFNAMIAPNASVGVGFQATHTGNGGAPPSFTLNGSPCTIA
jgi:peptidoglycan/xylan/chitin deacetylase (PgdA/CDA1 family)